MNWGHLLFGFTGRINRAKWWLAILIINILYVVVLIVALTTQSEGITGLLGVLFLIAWNWIGLAASAKRLHDLDRSGAWLLVFIGVPILLGLVAIGIVGIRRHHGRTNAGASGTCPTWKHGSDSRPHLVCGRSLGVGLVWLPAGNTRPQSLRPRSTRRQDLSAPRRVDRRPADG